MFYMNNKNNGKSNIQYNSLHILIYTEKNTRSAKRWSDDIFFRNCCLLSPARPPHEKKTTLLSSVYQPQIDLFNWWHTFCVPDNTLCNNTSVAFIKLQNWWYKSTVTSQKKKQQENNGRLIAKRLSEAQRKHRHHVRQMSCQAKRSGVNCVTCDANNAAKYLCSECFGTQKDWVCCNLLG